MLLQQPTLTKTAPYLKISPAPNSYRPEKSLRIMFFGAQRLWIPRVQVSMCICVCVCMEAHHAFSRFQPASFHVSRNAFLNQGRRSGTQMDPPSRREVGAAKGCAGIAVTSALQEAPSLLLLIFDADGHPCILRPERNRKILQMH